MMTSPAAKTQNTDTTHQSDSTPTAKAPVPSDIDISQLAAMTECRAERLTADWQWGMSGFG